VDVGDLVGVAEGRLRGQVDEDEEEAGQVDHVAHNHDRVSAPSGRFGSQDTEQGASCKLKQQLIIQCSSVLFVGAKSIILGFFIRML
jgi:hypothetical protein